MHTDPHDDGFERPGRLPHEIEQGLADASHVDNAARPDDPTDDAAHEHRVELDAPVTRPDLDAQQKESDLDRVLDEIRRKRRVRLVAFRIGAAAGAAGIISVAAAALFFLNQWSFL